MDKITKDQLVRTNAVYGGKLRQSNSLDYAVERANSEKNSYKRLAYLVRSMTSDHSFIDGNKRTAITVVLCEFENEGIKVNEKALTRTMIDLAKTGEGDITKIVVKLRRCSRR